MRPYQQTRPERLNRQNNLGTPHVADCDGLFMNIASVGGYSLTSLSALELAHLCNLGIWVGMLELKEQEREVVTTVKELTVSVKE